MVFFHEMDMIRKSQFNYQSIIEACGIQDVNIRKALDEKNEVIINLQEQFNTTKKLSNERNEKNENLIELKLTLDKNLQKFNKAYSKLSILDKEQKIVQGDIRQLNLELQEKSNYFVKKMADLDNELKTLFSQFEGETLTNLLSDLNTELLLVRDTEAQLEKIYDKLKKTPNDLSAYERPKILKDVFADIYEYKNFEEIDKKLANKKRNIQFLAAEYNKKMESLQKLS